MNYGIKLKEIRLEKKLSQQEIANILEIARITYNHYETQEKIIPLDRLNKICNFFNVSLDYVLELNSKKQYSKSEDELMLNIIAIRLKEFRKKNKITQDKLAKELNTTHSVIAGYETKRYLISTSFLYTICKKYNISADYLLGKIDYDPKL